MAWQAVKEGSHVYKFDLPPGTSVVDFNGVRWGAAGPEPANVTCVVWSYSQLPHPHPAEALTCLGLVAIASSAFLLLCQGVYSCVAARDRPNLAQLGAAAIMAMIALLLLSTSVLLPALDHTSGDNLLTAPPRLLAQHVAAIPRMQPMERPMCWYLPCCAGMFVCLHARQEGGCVAQALSRKVVALAAFVLSMLWHFGRAEAFSMGVVVFVFAPPAHRY